MSNDNDDDFFPTSGSPPLPSTAASGSSDDDGDDPVFGLLPAGTYRARLVHFEFGHSAVKGTPQVKVELQIIGSEYDGERIAHTMYFTPATRERTVRDLKTLGCKTDTKEDILNGVGLGSVEVRINLGHELRRDQTWAERVTAILPAADAVGTLEDQIRAALKTGARSGGGADAPPIRKPRRQ